VSESRKAAPGAGQSAIDAALAALADPARREAIELLRKRPRRSGELAEKLSLSPPAMSRHLRVLRSAGLVAHEPLDTQGAPHADARLRVYRLLPGPFAALRAWMAEIESGGAQGTHGSKR
jgi:DNA-binding transcriptional ArsR family regulator